MDHAPEMVEDDAAPDVALYGFDGVTPRALSNWTSELRRVLPFGGFT